MASKSSLFDSLKEENVPKFKNSWYVSILLFFFLMFDINVSAMHFFFNLFLKYLSIFYCLLSLLSICFLNLYDLRFCHDNIVTCSRDGSAIIWIPRSRKSHVSF